MLPANANSSSISLTGGLNPETQIRNLYFAGYFSRYDFDIFAFNPVGLPYKNTQAFGIAEYKARMDYGQYLDNSFQVSFINSFGIFSYPGHILSSFSSILYPFHLSLDNF